jgi:transposase
MQSTTIIAFDQHAATTVAAVLLSGQRTPALHPLLSDSPSILRFVARVRRQGPVVCCYEAGPCGFELPRALSAQQIPCDVIAPALIPRRGGGPPGSRRTGGMRPSSPSCFAPAP